MSELDIRGEECPMTYVKTSIALSQMRKGEILEVFVCGDEPVRNIPPALENEGHRILYIELLDKNTHKITVEKG
jgi:tRNA 2-thiouridine synthesizing protein A